MDEDDLTLTPQLPICFKKSWNIRSIKSDCHSFVGGFLPGLGIDKVDKVISLIGQYSVGERLRDVYWIWKGAKPFNKGLFYSKC